MSRGSSPITRKAFPTALVAACGLVYLATLAPGYSEGASAQRQRLESTPAGDCAACHGSEKVLPADHPQTKGLGLQDCRKCHEGEKLRGKLLLGHVHLLGGISCAGCHGEAKPQKASKTAQCLSCHGSAEKLADQTAKQGRNPHDSPHQGTSLDCDVCHRQHAKSENFCGQCHAWELKVP